METLLTKIGKLVATEINDVNGIEYLSREIGYTFIINMNDGSKILLSLCDTKL